jgi:hypothetical protein
MLNTQLFYYIQNGDRCEPKAAVMLLNWRGGYP